MELLKIILIFLVSLAALIYSSDKFISSAEGVGKFFKLPSFVIGVVLVGIGTSLPELVTSITSVNQGVSEFVVGNVFGSNVTNVLLVFGASALFSKVFTIKHDIMKTDIPFLIGATGFIAIATSDLEFSLAEGIICILLLCLYLFRSVKDGTLSEAIEEYEHHETKIWDWILVVVTPAVIYFSAKYLISSVVDIAEYIGVGNDTVALTIVALGTSLPELMVTIQAGRRGNAEMAVGNVLGSNLFNILAVMGIPALIGKLIIPESTKSFAIPMLLLSTILFFIITKEKKVYRVYGMFMIIFYIYFFGRNYGFF